SPLQRGASYNQSLNRQFTFSILAHWHIATLAHYFLYCHIISNDETPENVFPGVCFCLSSLFTEIEQKNFISLL
ncbi:hypothetical protein, partial [Parabacteroides goldsteinii]|uniref:hypothetical protein n=1 Tax=Parabacteroides goldsteinii TaxID=328812 RepID=UPI0025B6C3E8